MDRGSCVVAAWARSVLRARRGGRRWDQKTSWGLRRATRMRAAARDVRCALEICAAGQMTLGRGVRCGGRERPFHARAGALCHSRSINLYFHCSVRARRTGVLTARERTTAGGDVHITTCLRLCLRRPCVQSVPGTYVVRVGRRTHARGDGHGDGARVAALTVFACVKR